jgi:hypothetical protein
VAIVAPCTIVVVLLGGAVAAPVMPLADVPLFRLRCRVESSRSLARPPGSAAPLQRCSFNLRNIKSVNRVNAARRGNHGAIHDWNLEKRRPRIEAPMAPMTGKVPAAAWV